MRLFSGSGVVPPAPPHQSSSTSAGHSLHERSSYASTVRHTLLKSQDHSQHLRNRDHVRGHEDEEEEVDEEEVDMNSESSFRRSVTKMTGLVKHVNSLIVVKSDSIVTISTRPPSPSASAASASLVSDANLRRMRNSQLVEAYQELTEHVRRLEGQVIQRLKAIRTIRL
jgi:ABC-type uncharacterized transport system permease subunit